MLTLDTAFSLNTLCHWKFHWAICRLDEAVIFDSIRETFRPQREKLTLADIDKMIENVQVITREISRFLWEINTMSDNDYTVDLLKLLATQEKYQRYQSKLQFVNDAILRYTDEAFAELRKTTEHKLEKLNDNYY